jgi:hypothetical protein
MSKQPATDAQERFKLAVLEYVRETLSDFERQFPEHSKPLAANLTAGGSVVVACRYGMDALTVHVVATGPGEDGRVIDLGGFRVDNPLYRDRSRDYLN